MKTHLFVCCKCDRACQRGTMFQSAERDDTVQICTPCVEIIQNNEVPSRDPDEYATQLRRACG